MPAGIDDRVRGLCMHRSPRAAVIRRALALALLAGLVAGLPGLATAKDNAARKLGRGAANLSLGVLALPAEIVDTTREKGPFMGVTWGLVKGVGMTVATEVVGLWEILTCPYEFPPDWKPILNPEFPWQRFSAEHRARARSW
ncbi:MAG: exosortase system-associated protein, TIGR04073 family [Deltaproteobacteria bacterium]|nr:exosortase system-associated protein, TIGR04073 family [Deltaproteobacteria bacterium]